MLKNQVFKFFFGKPWHERNAAADHADFGVDQVDGGGNRKGLIADKVLQSRFEVYISSTEQFGNRNVKLFAQRI